MNRTYAQSRRGIAMLLVLISLMTATILTVSYLSSRDNSATIGNNVAESSAARWAAIAGLEIGKAIMETDTDWRTADAGGQLLDDYVIGDAEVDLVVEDSETGAPPTDETEYFDMTATATADNIVQVVTATAYVSREDPRTVDVDLSEFAMFTKGGIVLTDNATVMRWRKSPQAGMKRPINIGTTGTGASTVQVNGNATIINASVFAGPGASNSLVSNSTDNDLSTIDLTDTIPLPPAEERVEHWPTSDDDYPFVTADGSTITTSADDGDGMVSVRISANDDDAEQENDGDMRLNDDELNMGNVAWIGVRFAGVNIPDGATITSAAVEFEADDSDNELTSVTVFGEDSDAAQPFSTTANDISSRSRTTASNSIATVPAWSAHNDYRLQGLAPIIQEIIDRPGWNTGNPIAILIRSDLLTGHRRADSYNDSAADAPLLQVQYTGGAGMPGLDTSGSTISITQDVRLGEITLDNSAEMTLQGNITVTANHAFTVNNSTVTVDGDVTLVLYDGLTMDTGAIELTPGSTLTVHIYNDFDLADSYMGDQRAGNELLVDGTAPYIKPGTITVYSIPNGAGAQAALLADWGSVDSVWDLDGSGIVDAVDLATLLNGFTWDMSGSSVVKAGMYVPENTLTLTDNATLYGHATAKELYLRNDSSLYYDNAYDRGLGYTNKKSNLYDNDGNVKAAFQALSSLDAADLLAAADAAGAAVLTTDENGNVIKPADFDGAIVPVADTEPTPRPFIVEFEIESFGLDLIALENR